MISGMQGKKVLLFLGTCIIGKEPHPVKVLDVSLTVVMYTSVFFSWYYFLFFLKQLSGDLWSFH